MMTAKTPELLTDSDMAELLKKSLRHVRRNRHQLAQELGISCDKINLVGWRWNGSDVQRFLRKFGQ